MRVVITTTTGQVTWDSSGGDAAEVSRLVYNWQQWVAGEGRSSFAFLSFDGGTMRIDYGDIVSIEVAR